MVVTNDVTGLCDAPNLAASVNAERDYLLVKRCRPGLPAILE